MMLGEDEEYQMFFPLLDLLFNGNKHRHISMKVPFKEWNNDVINKENEDDLVEHYIKWFKHQKGLPDSDDEEEEG
jgi:hypothetical protein